VEAGGRVGRVDLLLAVAARRDRRAPAAGGLADAHLGGGAGRGLLRGARGHDGDHHQDGHDQNDEGRIAPQEAMLGAWKPSAVTAHGFRPSPSNPFPTPVPHLNTTLVTARYPCALYARETTRYRPVTPKRHIRDASGGRVGRVRRGCGPAWPSAPASTGRA